MSFVTRPILCGGVGCGFEMRSQLPLALDSSARTNTAKAGCLAQWLGDTVGPTEATTDSTSKVVDDSHAEDCKTWLFISGGTSGSDVPPLFFGKGGAVNITKTKEYALAQAHAAALLYHERLEGRSIKIHCEDDLTLAIVWDSGNFAHLCGLDYYLAYRNFCGALDWFSLSVGGVGVSRGGVEFVPVDAGPVCGRDAVVRFGRRCLFALPQGVGDE